MHWTFWAVANGIWLIFVVGVCLITMGAVLWLVGLAISRLWAFALISSGIGAAIYGVIIMATAELEGGVKWIFAGVICLVLGTLSLMAGLGRDGQDPDVDPRDGSPSKQVRALLHIPHRWQYPRGYFQTWIDETKGTSRPLGGDREVGADVTLAGGASNRTEQTVMTWKRGLFRLWFVLSLGWVAWLTCWALWPFWLAGVAWPIGEIWPLNGIFWFGVILPPLLLLLTGWIVAWVLLGFRVPKP